MADAVSAALPQRRPGVGGLLEDGRPAPFLAPGALACSVYVDNTNIPGATFDDADGARVAVQKDLRDRDLVVGDVTPPGREVEAVGLYADLRDRWL
eukprot:710902-Lingulodinium_polyedra.AAC.1